VTSLIRSTPMLVMTTEFEMSPLMAPCANDTAAMPV